MATINEVGYLGICMAQSRESGGRDVLSHCVMAACMKIGSTTLVHGCSDDFLRAIGDVTVSYANLQWTLDIVVCTLLDGLQEDKRGVVTSNLSFSQLSKLLDALYVHQEPKPIPYDEFAEVVKKLDRVAEKRNRLNHSMIMPSSDEIRLISFDKNKKGKGLRTLESAFSISDVNGLKDDIQSVGGDLLAIYMSIK